MAAREKTPRQRIISYVLPLEHSTGGHRSGVNGLAVDSNQSILYSGGRDGSICAWNLNLDLKKTPQTEDPFASPDDPPAAKPKTVTTFRTQIQAHTHWVNDIALAQDNTALVSASSDLTVKIWRPLSNGSDAPQTIGQHSDYVKCLATPNSQADWVASGGLDRRICLWDLNGAGKKLEIEVKDEEESDKGSVYALAVSKSMIASGGPESIVRLWDPRSGKRVTKFMGHTNNIRDILINETGDTIMTASSDQTVKVWSVTAGRCMHTLTMHNDSVWSLYSADPELGVFYSSDRSGLVVKTDVRNTLGELDNGLSVAIAQENDGVSKVLACGEHIWTANSSSSINRWADVDTGNDAALPDVFRHHRASSIASQKPISPPTASAVSRNPSKEIPALSILRITHTASFPTVRDSDAATIYSTRSARKGSEIIMDPDIGIIVPVHSLPEETIEGQHGLVKHKLLNDRRRVLTLDTAGDVVLWDLINCVPIQSFGKKHLEDVEPEVNTLDAISPWCSVNTRTGRLAVVLEENNCFDGEMYADELQTDDALEFRDDQRINLAKWVLRHLFTGLIDEMIKRDEIYRKGINEGIKQANQQKAPLSIEMPESTYTKGFGSPLTPRANGGSVPMTPGMGIGVATPGAVTHMPGVPEDEVPMGTGDTKTSAAGEKSGDYFSSTNTPSNINATPKPAATPGITDEKPPQSPSDADKETNGKDGRFGKKFSMKSMGMPFGGKKLGRSPSVTVEKPVVVEEKVDDSSEASDSGEKEKEKHFDDSFSGVIQKIRNKYDTAIQEYPTREVESGIAPSLPAETPVLKLPASTTVIIQEETSGGSVDLYRGTVASVSQDASLIEEMAPKWLGEFLLKNHIPEKTQEKIAALKISFVVQPWKNELPSIPTADGHSRLSANRMLRVKKILGYVADRIEDIDENAEPDPNELKPEEFLELYCNEQKLPVNMSLATLRAHVWKGGADVVLYYKDNGRKKIKLLRDRKSAEAAPASAPVAAVAEQNV
ncbi:WD repeat protein-like protein [Calycina marina]|uniref:WD repeat protein-like protein n=1 Tax=Calycina marina TaxID=1763456 RepID=A0A9P7ZAV7_9HELO|nr:WD repeat protein-like protein [Calycina marina]